MMDDFIQSSYGQGINLCCPEGEIYTIVSSGTPDRCGEIDYDTEELGCAKYEETLPSTWSLEGDDKEYKLIGSDKKYKCPNGQAEVAASILFENASMSLSPSNVLVVMDDETNQTWNFTNFCVFFTDLNGDVNTGQLTICDDGETEEEKEELYFTGIFYPAAIGISALFILFSLIHLCITSDRKKTNFVHTFGFLINVLICYIILCINYSLYYYDHDALIGTTICKVLGYMVHHTFMAFFFWTSAMAFSIARTFSTMKQSSRSKTVSWKGLILNILYAQGIPMVITLTTALMDSYGPCDSVRPNMGKYQCFLGSEQYTGDSFFQSSEFLYYYLAVAIIIVTNLIFFSITGFCLCKHWHQMRNIQSSSGDGITKQFWIVLKLSIIMGIPWIGDIISSWLKFESGFQHTFAIRLCLDIINLLTGILIFTVLVGFKPFIRKIREKTGLSYTKSTSLSSRKSEYKNTSLSSRKSEYKNTSLSTRKSSGI